AAGAWALLEPHFDDSYYLQGPLEKIERSPRQIRLVADPPNRSAAEAEGIVQVRGQPILLLPETLALWSDGRKQRLKLDRLTVGQPVGVYAEFIPNGDEGVWATRFVVPDPPPGAGTDPRMTLEDAHRRSRAIGLLLFPTVSAFVGLAIAAADGFVCRLVRRVLLAGAVGLVAGFIGGFVCTFIAELVYAPLTMLALKQEGNSVGSLSTLGFVLQVAGRGLAWALAGIAMGLGQGLALRSSRLLLYGFLGGIVGGLLGGLLFDPIYFFVSGSSTPSAHWSRLIGFMVIGASVGAMIGVVELLARDAWLRMTDGPLAGKEFLIFKDVMAVGASPRSDIYLFNDPAVAARHAVIRAVGDNYEIESVCREQPALVNGRMAERARLRHGDQIGIGRTVFVFQTRKG
ncbi:MAG TPA: FHA domain-containing protein, partial [Roseiflexaceae bacterium]